MLMLSPSSTVLTVETDAAVFRRLLPKLVGVDLESPEVLDLESHENGLVNFRPGSAGGAGGGPEAGTAMGEGLDVVDHGTDGRLDINVDMLCFVAVESREAAPGESIVDSAIGLPTLLVFESFSSSLLPAKFTSSSEVVDKR